jgi:hypothetical protein
MEHANCENRQLNKPFTEEVNLEVTMNKAMTRSFSAKYLLWSTMLLMAMAAMLLSSPKPATAGSSFSIGLGFGGGSVVYRSWSGGGYRDWHPGWSDRWHHFHDGYYYGPVIYSAPADAYFWTNGGPRYYHHYGGGYGHANYNNGGNWGGDHGNFRGGGGNWGGNHGNFRGGGGNSGGEHGNFRGGGGGDHHDH